MGGEISKLIVASAGFVFLIGGWVCCGVAVWNLFTEGPSLSYFLYGIVAFVIAAVLGKRVRDTRG
jgi:hypothetical protein